jgi:phosphohistidine phosphatase
MTTELLLWRHADAVNGRPDHARELSEKGRKQARVVANWLEKHAPQEARLVASPATRARQTAGFFRKQMEILAALASEATADEILALLDWPQAQTPVIVVGHQPMLSEIADRLLPEGDARSPGARSPDARSPFGKGELWWFSSITGTRQVILRVRVRPNELIGMQAAEIRTECDRGQISR